MTQPLSCLRLVQTLGHVRLMPTVNCELHLATCVVGLDPSQALRLIEELVVELALATGVGLRVERPI